MPTLAVLGAFDRFNYGDLLFPLIVEQVARSQSSAFRLEYYATLASDLRRLGGKATRPLRHLLRRGTLTDGSAVLVAGGEVLDADWVGTLDNVLPPPLVRLLSQVHGRCGTRSANALGRALFGPRLAHPWILAPDDFRAEVRVAYNCVGGSSLSRLPQREQGRILAKLSRAAYLSVRDQATQSVLEERLLETPVHLAPDCAVLMSRYYPLSELERLASPAAHRLLAAHPDGYFCFQINKNHGTGQAAQAAAQLEAIFQRHQLPALLLPIGRARNHEDQLPLAEIHAALHTPASFAEGELTVHDIMLLIARARAFAGTSLHGNLTALAYAVPHLGLTRRVPKLESFLRTWDLAQQAACAPLEELSDRLAPVLALPRPDLEARRDELQARSLANFSALFAALGIVKQPAAIPA